MRWIHRQLEYIFLLLRYSIKAIYLFRFICDRSFIDPMDMNSDILLITANLLLSCAWERDANALQLIWLDH